MTMLNKLTETEQKVVDKVSEKLLNRFPSTKISFTVYKQPSNGKRNRSAEKIVQIS